MSKKKRPIIRMGRRATLRAVDGDAGRHRWRLEWYPQGAGGKMRTRSIGPRGWRGSAADAEIQAREMLLDVDLDARAPEPEPEPETYTVEDLLQLWLGSQRQELEIDAIAPRTLKTKIGAAKRLLGGRREDPNSGPPLLRYVPLDQLTHDRLRDHVRACADSAPATLRLDVRQLRQAWKWGQREGIAPPRDLVTPRLPRARPAYSRHTPTPAEAEAVLAAMRSQRNRGAYQLVWGTGARIAEASTCTPDLDAGSFLITGKTGSRRIPMTPRARAGLDELRRAGVKLDAERLFPPATLRRAITRACSRAEVTHHSPHGLRRLAVDELRRAGVPLEVAAAITGHSVEVMLGSYRRASEAEIRAAMEAAPVGGTVLLFPRKATG